MESQTLFELCAGCERFTGAECVVPLEDDLDLETCFRGEIMNPLQRFLERKAEYKARHSRSEFKLKGEES